MPSGATLFSNLSAWTVESPVLTAPEDGWDTLVIHEVVSAGSNAAAQSTYTKGAASADYTAMFCADMKSFAIIPGQDWYDLVSTWKGLAEDKPAKWSINSYSERNTYQLVNAPGFTIPGPGDISEPKVGLTARYISIDIPDGSEVGTAVTPSLDYANPANIWASAPNVVQSYPFGWTLDKRESETIAGATIFLITDYFVYYQPWRPQK